MIARVAPRVCDASICAAWQHETDPVIAREAIADRLWGICDDPVTFPVENQPYRNGCFKFIQAHFEALEEELLARMDPESDKFEEDIATWYFCREIGACGEEQESLDQQLRKWDL